jgi:hypothetical protein
MTLMVTVRERESINQVVQLLDQWADGPSPLRKTMSLGSWMALFAAFYATDESPCLLQSRSPFVFYLGSLHQVIFDFEFAFGYMVVHKSAIRDCDGSCTVSIIIDCNGWFVSTFTGPLDMNVTALDW